MKWLHVLNQYVVELVVRIGIRETIVDVFIKFESKNIAFRIWFHDRKGEMRYYNIQKRKVNRIEKEEKHDLL